MILAERALIGSLIIAPEKEPEVSAVLSPDMFGSGLLGKAFFEIVQMSRDGVGLSLAALLQRLEPQYPRAAEELAECVECGELVGIMSNADVIRREHIAREAVDIINRVEFTGSNADQSITETVAALTALVKPSPQNAVTLAEMAESMAGDFFTDRAVKKLDFGLVDVDKATGGIEGGDFVIIAARPAVGKSAFALQAVQKFAHDGLNVAYFNLEMQKRQVMERLIASAGGIRLSRVRRGVEFLGDERERYTRAIEKIKKLDNITVFTRSGVTVADIRAVAAGFDVIVVDYLQLLRSDGRRGSNRWAEVGDISHGLKAIAMEFNIPVIALAQLNRASAKGEEPTMSELRESGDLEQDASVVMLLWEEDVAGVKVKHIKIDKARQGQPGAADLDFCGEYMTFNGMAGFERSGEDDHPFN